MTLLPRDIEAPIYPTNSLKFLEVTTPPPESNGTIRPTVSGPLRLDIVVVGAGLGGLASAVALSLQGHHVTVVEQAPVLAEVGAGIQIPPNSVRHLQDWDVGSRLDAISAHPAAMTFRRWENGNVIANTPLDAAFRAKYHAPYYVVHRADFHTVLHERAVELGVKVHLNSVVETYDPEKPEIITTDGRTFTGDLIIAADGLNSKARKVIDETAEDPVRTPFAAYRATAPTDEMRKDPETAWLLEQSNLNIWIGDGRHVMSYMISGGKTFNFVLVHKDSSDPSTWDRAAAFRDMHARFDGWDPSLTKVMAKVDKCMKWPLLVGSEQKRWVAKSGRLLILGDAAHAMLPFMSQGAAMAVEDAAALATALSYARSRDDIPRVLETFEEVRSLRTKQMQQASHMNSILWHFADGPTQQARDAAMEAEVKGEPFEHSANQWSDPVTQQWAYGYDAVNTIADRLYTRAS